MKIYRIEYKRWRGDDWWPFIGRQGTGLYEDRSTAQSIVTRMINNGTFVEAHILESDGKWDVVEWKGR